MQEVESTIVQAHLPCDSCGSSDALSEYSDGHTFCFSCGNHERGEGGITMITTRDENHDYVKGTVKPLKARGITQETCQKFGYSVGTYNGEKVQVATYRSNGKIVGQKIRTKNKDFRWIGPKNPPLYGQHLWKAGGKVLTICEGEIDALSMSQVNDNKWAVVSVPGGAQNAAAAIKRELEYVNSFEKVVLLFDQDEAGVKAAYEVAPLLAPGKAFIGHLPLKDANEMLLAGRKAEMLRAMWDATAWKPEGIVDAGDLWEELSTEQPTGLSYPWPSLTKALYGIRPDEIITIIAGTGIGKSQVFKEVAFHLISEHKEPVGLFMMEESNKTTALNLIGMSMDRPIHLPDHPASEEEKKEHFDKVFGSGQVYMYNHFGSASFNEIVSKMRYLAVSCDVKHIFIDHLACFTVSETAIKDERKELDTIISTLASLCRELNITLYLISHLNSGGGGTPHEEGGHVSLRDIRGTRGIGQWSSTILSLQRNQQEEDPALRHQTTLRVLKDRFGGKVGEKVTLTYDPDTGRIKEATPIEKSPFEKPKPSEADFTDF